MTCLERHPWTPGYNEMQLSRMVGNEKMSGKLLFYKLSSEREVFISKGVIGKVQL